MTYLAGGNGQATGFMLQQLEVEITLTREPQDQVPTSKVEIIF
jgi:hypothetical protein